MQYNLERKEWLSKMNIQIETSSDDNMLNNIFLFPRISAKYIVDVKNHCSVDMYILKLCTINCGVYILCLNLTINALKLLLCYESGI